jgi:hypothetical protein
MTLERLRKPQMVVPLESVQQPKVRAVGKPTHAKTPATPAQLQRAKAKVEQDRTTLQRASEQASLDRETRDASVEQVRVQRLQEQVIAQEQQTRVQRLAEIQAKQQAFFSSFNKTPTQRKSLENVKTSSMTASKTRDQYQAAIQSEIVQRLVNDQMTASIQASRVSQQPNALQVRADWFNTELPILRAQHNHPNTPFADTSSVFKPMDQQAFSLGNTYKLQRLASGLTPRDAASAILGIQRKADRDIALQGLLTGVHPRQSDYASIQRLVAAGEYDLEVQRRALLEGDEIQRQAFQLAKEEAHPTTPNSGISEKIKAKLGGGSPLPENVRNQLETGLNVSLERVRVHTDGEADKLAKSVNAIAFTTGNAIFFSSGSYNPNTKTGYELIAHEVTHTVQQASGLVSAGIDKDSSLESAAQAKGAELAASFDPNAKPKAGSSFKNLQNGPQPNSPLISSQPPAHRAKIQAMQRSRMTYLETTQITVSTPKIGNLEGLQRSAPMFGSPTLQRSVDGTVIQRSWWNPFDWAKEAAGWLGEKFMDGLEWMGEKAAKAFMEVFAVAAKPFGETGKQVLNAIKSIGSSLLNVIKNPGQFARNLIEGIKLGFGNFITNAPKHLTSVLGSFLGGKGLNLTFPTKLEPLPILMAFISSLNLGWDRIKLKIAAQLGPKGGQAITAAEKAPGIVQTISKGLHNSDEFTKEVLPTLKTEAVDGIKSAAQEGLIRAGIGVLLKLIPGAGTVLAIFDTVRVLIDRGRDIVSLASNVMGAFSAIASGNLASAAIAVENSLVSGIKVALDFIAKLAKIDTFIDKVRGIIGKVTTKISSVVDPIIKKAANFVRPYLDKLTGKPSNTTAVKPGSVNASPPQPTNGTTGKQPTKPGAQPTAPVQIPNGPIGAKLQVDGDKTPHHVWAEIQGGQPIIMMASTPMNIIDQLKGLKADAKAHLDPASNDFKTVDSSISKAGQHVGVGISQMKTQLQTAKTNPNPGATSNTVKGLDIKQITGTLEGISKTTLQNVRGDLQPAFPIMAKANGGVLPSVGVHPLKGKDQESHHVPAAELATAIYDQYLELAKRVSGNPAAPVKALHAALWKQANVIAPFRRLKAKSLDGIGLSAILLHKDTHRECKLGNAVHKNFLADAVKAEIEGSLQPGEQRVVMVTGKAGKRQLSVNPQASAWKAFLQAVHSMTGVTRATPQGTGELVEVTGDEKALDNVANSITNMLKTAPAGRLQVVVNRIRDEVNSLTTEAFNHALGNGISAVKVALAHSTKDGDHAQHGNILDTLKNRADQVWRSQVIGKLA